MHRTRRYYASGAAYFFTVVTENRNPFLCEPWSRECLREAIGHVRKKHDFEVIAFVLLPDHLHCIWKLPTEESDFSLRWRLIKRRFTVNARNLYRRDFKARPAKGARHEAGFWQRRFWEHFIRDEADLSAHVDYIHWNPVKHKLVKHPSEWPWSTYHKFREKGYYRGDETATSFPDEMGGE